MKEKCLFVSFSLLSLIFLVSFQNKKAENLKETKVLIQTSLGEIKLKLYNETPKHRDNFIKLIEGHVFDSTLFHRVIQRFMIQGGDPDSKKAAPGAMLGNGNVGYTISAEFNPKLFHKRGVLAAARESDDINPNKESSGCQFYIVQGRTFTQSDLDGYEIKMNTPTKQKLFNEIINREENKSLKDKFIAYQQANKMDSLQVVFAQINPILEKEFEETPHFKFNEEQRIAYTTIGGAPHLDGNYTVFGEVIEGMDVVDKIAAMQADGANRPLTDIRMTIKIIK